MSDEARFWAKVNKDGPRFSNRGRCWLWTGAIQDGYGQFSVKRRRVRAARWLWEQKHGPVPAGLELDHLCRNRACVRLSHLQAVTCQVNIRRGDSFAAHNVNKTHCPAGHPYTGYNLYIAPNGKRHCRTCRVEWTRRWRQQRAAA